MKLLLQRSNENAASIAARAGETQKHVAAAKKVNPVVVKLSQLERPLHTHLQQQPRSHSESWLSPVGASLKGSSKQLSPVFSRKLIGCGILRPVAKTFSWSLVGFHEWKPQEVCRCILTLLYFVLGVTEGQKKQTQEAPVDSWLGMDKERGPVDGQKA